MNGLANRRSARDAGVRSAASAGLSKRMQTAWRATTAISWRIALALLVTATLSASRLDAQHSAMVGSVRDDLGRPVEGAEIMVGGLETRTLTDANGRFRVPDVAYGLTSIAARRIGFLPLADLIKYSPADTLEFVLEHLPQKVDTVKVVARADAVWESDMRRFAWATESARSGATITDRDIAKRRPLYTTDLLTTHAGFRVVGDGASAKVVSTRTRCTAK